MLLKTHHEFRDQFDLLRVENKIIVTSFTLGCLQKGYWKYLWRRGNSFWGLSA